MSWARARRSTARTGRPRSAEVQASRGTAVGVTEIKTDGADDCATREAFFGFDTRFTELEMEPTCCLVCYYGIFYLLMMIKIEQTYAEII